MRRPVHFAALWLTLASVASAQQIYWERSHDVSGELLAEALFSIDDLNGDGHRDFIESSSRFADYHGRVWGRSGTDGSELFSLVAPAPNTAFGYRAASVSDTDGDGLTDFAVTAMADGPEGSVSLYSGANASLQLSVQGLGAGDGLGSAVVGMGDVDGDGRGDFAASAVNGNGPSGGGTGYVMVYSGRTGSSLTVIEGPFATRSFGSCLEAITDVDGDGVMELAVGDPLWDSNSYAGAVHVYSGANGRLLHTTVGSSGNDRYGLSIAGIDDQNGDGFEDLLVGAPGMLSTLNSSGYARIVSGLDGTTLATFSSRGMFGTEVAHLDDLNGDGYTDFLVSGSMGRFGGDVVHWYGLYTRIYSGRDHSELYYIRESGGSASDGIDGAGLGDVDGDGLSEFVLGQQGWPGRITARRGNDLFLHAEEKIVAAGSTLALGLRSGPLNGVAALVLTHYDDQPVFSILAITNLNAGGHADLSLPIPLNAASHNAKLQAASISAAGFLLASTREEFQFY